MVRFAQNLIDWVFSSDIKDITVLEMIIETIEDSFHCKIFML